MEKWVKTFEGHAVNLDLCTQLCAKYHNYEDIYTVRAFFPGYDGGSEPYLDIKQCESKEEAIRFIESLINKNHKTVAQDLAEILR